MEIDIDKLREDLLDEFNAAYFAGFKVAIIDITRIENASPEQLIQIALDNNIDLSNYQVHKYR